MDANDKYELVETTHYYVRDTETDMHLYDGADKEEAEALLANLREMHELRLENAARSAAGEPLVVDLEDSIKLTDSEN